MGKATKVKGRETLVNRDFYERLKRSDRQEAENMIWNIYDKGYAAGVKKIDSFVDHLQTVPGMGEVVLSKIQTALQEWVK